MKNIVSYEHLTSHINEAENTYQAITAKKDFDHFNAIVVPAMKSAGFKRVTEPAGPNRSPYGAGYFCYPDHNKGVNLFLDTPLSSHWKYVVYYAGNKGVKEFGWKIGTDAEVKKAATDAVNYAIKLKNQNFKKINEEYMMTGQEDTEMNLADIKSKANQEWPSIESALKNIKPCKVIKMQDGDTSLNWGLFQGPNGGGGFSISKFGSLNFTTGIEAFYNDVAEYMQSKGMEIPKFSGFNEKMGTFHIFTGPDYIWKYSSKDLIDVAKFIATKVSAR